MPVSNSNPLELFWQKLALVRLQLSVGFVQVWAEKQQWAGEKPSSRLGSVRMLPRMGLIKGAICLVRTPGLVIMLHEIITM